MIKKASSVDLFGIIAKWLWKKSVEKSREPITTGLDKMAGCLPESGLMLSAVLIIGIRLSFN